MQAYIPPHRRQQTLASVSETNQLKITTFVDDGLAGRCDRPSLSNRRVMSSCGVLLQAHGDSFVGPLTELKDDAVDVRRYSGATAKGLDNERSSQRVGQRLVTCLDNTRPGKVLLQFGNVDINISSVYRLETNGEAEWDEQQFIANVWNSYQAFLEKHILRRLDLSPDSSSSPTSSKAWLPVKPGYIRDLYLCEATLPIVTDEALPESHAKYQDTAIRKEAKRRGLPDLNVGELEIQRADRVECVRSLIHLCGLQARRRMTADFNSRLKAFVLGFQDILSHQGSARLHLVNLNQYICKEPQSDEVDAQFITEDPTNLHIKWENTLPFWVLELASAGLCDSHMPSQQEREETWAKYSARKREQKKRRETERDSPDSF